MVASDMASFASAPVSSWSSTMTRKLSSVKCGRYAEMPLQQQRKRAVGHLVGGRPPPAALDVVEDLLRLVPGVLGQIDAQFAFDERCLTGQLADQHALRVAHRLGDACARRPRGKRAMALACRPRVREPDAPV